MGTVTVSKEGKITPPPNPTKEGYIFDGWYKEPECVNEWNFECRGRLRQPGRKLWHNEGQPHTPEEFNIDWEINRCKSEYWRQPCA